MPARKKVKPSVTDNCQAYAALDFIPEYTNVPSPPPSATTSNQNASKKAGGKAERKATKELEKTKAAEKGKEKAKHKKKAKRAKEWACTEGSDEDQSSDQSDSNAPGSDARDDSDSGSNAPLSSDEEPVKKTHQRKPVNKSNLDLSKLNNHTPNSSKLLKASKKRVEANIFLSNALPSLTDSTASGAIAWKKIVRANRDISRGGT
jgi:hypothetical protein